MRLAKMLFGGRKSTNCERLERATHELEGTTLKMVQTREVLDRIVQEQDNLARARAHRTY